MNPFARVIFWRCPWRVYLLDGREVLEWWPWRAPTKAEHERAAVVRAFMP